MGDAASGAVAVRAGIFRGNNDVGGLGALRGVVTIRASHRRVFAMIEFPMEQPAFGDGRFSDLGFASGICFDFMAVGATGIHRGWRAFDRADATSRRER